MKGDNNQILKTKHESAKAIIKKDENKEAISKIVDGLVGDRMN